MNKCVLVTGGSGFIGSALIRLLLQATDWLVVNVDKLTYAASPNALASAAGHPRYRFYQQDICDTAALSAIFALHQPHAVMHLAAESHVDNSIQSALPFMQSNIIGTFSLLEASRAYFAGLTAAQQQAFRFLHVSTDEVYGDLPVSAAPLTEEANYQPSSPYSASKAASDHLVFAWQRTYGLPVLMTHCTNNYGPFQHAEKLIPLMISRALQQQALPVYGDGQQIRDWLYVDDHAQALLKVLTSGSVGERYNVSGNNQLTNLTVVHTLCELLDELASAQRGNLTSYKQLIQFVTDRPGHDRRYALNSNKLQRELQWQAQTRFADGLRHTLLSYLP